MRKTTINASFLRPLSGRHSGSAILAALGLLAVTLIAVGAALFESSNRFHTSHLSSRWAQAGHAAEAGAEIALLTLQGDSWTADGWSGVPGAPGTSPVTKTITLSTGVPATGPVSARVSVDKVTMGSEQWLRLRSTGIADVSGGARAGIDPQDNMLRKVSLRKDRATGATLTTPRATRTCEILAGPKSARPFAYTFVSKELFDIHATSTSDSYDSSDPTKSNFTPFTTYGIYDAAKRQQNGDVGTTDAAHMWNLNDAHIWGDVLTPTGSVDHTSNVHGSVTSAFSFNYPTEVAPTWAAVTTHHGVVTNVNKTITAGTQASPPRHKFTSIELTAASKKIKLQNPAGVTESWVELWVTGDTIIAGVSLTGIEIDPGVHATIHFGEKVEIKGGGGGYAISNGSKRPENLIIRAYGGSSGATKDFLLAYTDFWGVLSAPWYKVKFDTAGKHVHGSYLSWQFDVTDGTNLHYDEALANFSYGSSSTYEVKSWVEAVR